MKKKLCSGCKALKDGNTYSFDKCSSTEDGLNDWCKDCVRDKLRLQKKIK